MTAATATPTAVVVAPPQFALAAAPSADYQAREAAAVRELLALLPAPPAPTAKAESLLALLR